MHFCVQVVSLQRVFHSIRFKVNKVGIQWYPFFCARTVGVAGRRVGKSGEKHVNRLKINN